MEGIDLRHTAADKTQVPSLFAAASDVIAVVHRMQSTRT